MDYGGSHQVKILFLTVDVEENMRGIGAIMKNLIKAARAEGHEVGLLTGIPYQHAYEGNSELRDRIEHVHLQHYLIEGRKSFKYMFRDGYRKRNIILKVVTLGIFRHAYMKIRPELLSGKRTLAYDLDFIVRSPFIYQFIARNKTYVSRKALGNITRAYDIDLVIAVSPTILRNIDLAPKTKLATFIHDTMPVDMIETPADENTPVKFATQIETATLHSDLLLANSEDTANKVRQFAPYADIEVVYGVSSSAREDIGDSAILEIKGLQAHKYLLFVAVLEKRKNIEGLFEAYTLAYPNIKIPLVIVGASGYGYKTIMAKYKSLPSHIRDNIIMTGYVSESDKFTLFKYANAFVFPSFYEGIGLQIVEALSYHLPVLTSQVGALVEAAGNAALYVKNPYNVHEIAEGLVRIVNDTALREQLVTAGDKQCIQFTFDKFQDRVTHALDKLKRHKR